MSIRKLISALILFVLPVALFSQEANQNSLQSQSGLALIIGNEEYPSGILLNPKNDDRAMSAVLENLGFTVLGYENLDQREMKKAIDEFGYKLKNYDYILITPFLHILQLLLPWKKNIKLNN